MATTTRFPLFPLQCRPLGAAGAAGVHAQQPAVEAGNEESDSAWAVTTVLERVISSETATLKPVQNVRQRCA